MTGKYYYSQMPLRLRAMWLEEVNLSGEDVTLKLEGTYRTFSSFINGSFKWSNSTQGYNFWTEIAKENFQVGLSIIDRAVEMLQCIDGEQLEELIRKLGMEGQILRQLFLKASQAEVDALITEKNFLQKIK